MGVPRWVRGGEWRPEARPIVAALDEYLDVLIGRIERCAVHGAGPGPVVPTGVPPLDEMLDGGLRRGRVTVLETSMAGPAHSLLYTIARRSRSRVLIGTSDPHRSCQGLVAAEADIAEFCLDDVLLTDDDWDEVGDALRRLAHLDVHLSGLSPAELAGAIATLPGTGAVLLDAPSIETLDLTHLEELHRIAAGHDVAVVSVTGPLGELPAWVSRGIDQIVLSSFAGGLETTLVRTDDFDMLRLADLSFDPLSGALRPMGPTPISG